MAQIWINGHITHTDNIPLTTENLNYFMHENSRHLPLGVTQKELSGSSPSERTSYTNCETCQSSQCTDQQILI